MIFDPNPFFVGKPVPPEKFLGRKRYLDEAFDLIEQRCHTAIWGADGMGKTSLLKYLESSQCWELQGYNSQDAVIIYLNCSEIIPFAPTLFWREIISHIKEKNQENSELLTIIDQELASQNIGKDGLRRILRIIGKQGIFLLALIDEFDVIFGSYSGVQLSEIHMKFSNAILISILNFLPYLIQVHTAI